MALELKNISKRIGAENYIYPTDLVFERGSFNILLGTTLAGKTTLMQLIAGIQAPSTGEIWYQGRNITKTPVQARNVSMVYQQFINYPHFSVYENIASPLRVAKLSEKEINQRVCQAAELLKLTPMLQRKPSELSGGQQQRTAIARALVKDSDIILLDEPLANLDYKLREELRDELPKIFSGRDAIVIYATTEPIEALLFGGQTLLMREGCVTQKGPTAEIYRQPNSLVSAQVFAEPPLNFIQAHKKGQKITLFAQQEWPFHRKVMDGDYLIGIRPHHVETVQPSSDWGEIRGRVVMTELSGSESLIHIKFGDRVWVMQLHGVQPYVIGEEARFYIDIHKGLFFNQAGEFVQ